MAAILSALAGGPLIAQEGVPAQPAVHTANNYYTVDEPAASEYQALLNRLQAAEIKIDELENRGANVLPAPPSPRADGTPGVPTPEQRLAAVEQSVQAAPKGPRFPNAKLSGFFHLDAGMFDQDDTSRATLGDIQDGVGFRRARLQAVGSVSEFTNYSLEMDFATAGRPSFMDVWGEQTHIPILGNVRIGHFRQPTNMDSWTSVRSLEFLERTLPFQAFDPFRRVGIMAYDKSNDEMWSWAYGIYRTGGFGNAPIGDSRFGIDIGDQGGFSTASRLNHLLYFDEATEGRYLFHVGGFYNYSRMTGNNATGPFYQARAIPEFFVGDPAGGNLTVNGTPTFVDTGRLSADHYDYYGFSVAGQYGAAHFQAEYMGTSVDQISAPNVYYDGMYLQGGYFLTGENLKYDRTSGVFGGVTPFTDFFALGRQSTFCGWGAWEVTGRVSYLDLTDPNAAPILFTAGPPPSPNAGRMTDTTLGLNWYWNPYTRLQFNWIHAFVDNSVTGNSDCDIWCTRFQLGF
jgi:phosphate-selective porin OprO/OprP